tara:strand:+ start:127 stop:807 length:681 start_codon:yes stop_codon:yes gene_type:complete
MTEFASCKKIKDYLNSNKIKNIILLSQARSGSTFATHNLSEYLGYKKEDVYPEEYFLNRHFSYVKSFTKKHKNFFMNINEFFYRRSQLNRSDTLFLYLYRDPDQIINSYEKAKKNGYYQSWNEFYSRYRIFFPDINKKLNTPCFNHEIWNNQKKFFTHSMMINFDDLKELPGFKDKRDNFKNLKQIGDNKIISINLNNKLNFNIFEKIYFFIRRRLESRKKNIKNY